MVRALDKKNKKKQKTKRKERKKKDVLFSRQVNLCHS